MAVKQAKREWIPIEDVLEVIKPPKWTWARNAHCKYLDIRLDTRDGACLIKNRHGDPITLEDLKRQHGETP